VEETIKPHPKLITKYLWVLITVSILILVLIGIIHFIIILANGDMRVPPYLWSIGLIICVVLLAVGYPWSILWVKNLSYIIREDRVSINKGILTKTQQNIPFRAVTDFALQRTLYDRFLGIGSIQIQTAGQKPNSTSSYEGILSGLVEYEKFHNQMREKIKRLYPISEALGTAESSMAGTEYILKEILQELKAIRKNTEK
jgi:uncharacterized membrane protein YdbT with pleckstrin-like domain